MAHYATDSFLMIVLDPNKLHPFTKKVLEEVVGINLEQGLPTLSGELSFEVEYKEGGCSQDIEWTNFFDQVLEGDDLEWYSDRVYTLYADPMLSIHHLIKDMITKGILQQSFLEKMNDYHLYESIRTDCVRRQFLMMLSDFNDAIKVSCTNSFYSSIPVHRDGLGADVNFVSKGLYMFVELEDINTLATQLSAPLLANDVDKAHANILDWVQSFIVSSVTDEAMRNELHFRFGGTKP